jgi:tRNA nucleotidyltransferase (CCA-adding enzyme)
MEARKAGKAEMIFHRVLADIKPSQAETNATIANINTVTSRLAGIVEKGVELRVVGSVARGTNLKGDADIDIFMLFHKKTGKEELVRKGLAYGKKLASGKRDRFEIKYAEHPYIRVYLEGLGVRIDLVPALKIDNIEEMGTTVDRTPLHTDFINSNMTERQRDETRLLKYLLKAHNIYGAEVRVGGFPGYLCELLILQFGSLIKLLESAATFELPVILDPKTRGRQGDQQLVKRFNSKFIVIDPVDSNRNVGAGVSPESLSRFVMVARRFVDNPSAELFFGKGFPSPAAGVLLRKFTKDSGLSLYMVKLRVPDKSEDVVWPQLRKTSGIMADTLSRHGYGVFLSAQWISGHYGFLLFALPGTRIETRLLKGPSVFMRQAAGNFIKGHSRAIGALIKGTELYALEKNRYGSAEEAFRDMIRKGRKARKDIRLGKAMLFVNSIPKEYAGAAYSELMKKLQI